MMFYASYSFAPMVTCLVNQVTHCWPIYNTIGIYTESKLVAYYNLMYGLMWG